MAEESLRDFFPEMREVENKVGRKTPESLLRWMRDAADSGDRCDVVDRGDHSSAFSGSFSDRISCLKREMRWLRSADVRILRQLVTVHEGIEAMRWMMEERGSLASRGSSLTGSLSSLVTLEEHGLSMTPRRESQSPSLTQDLTETTAEESESCRSPHDDATSLHKSYLDVLSPQSVGVSSPGRSCSKFDPSTQDMDITPGASAIHRALLRSRKARVRADTDFKPVSGEIQESFRAAQKEDEENASNTEAVLPGYDAQWCWVESQDDVTFL